MRWNFELSVVIQNADLHLRCVVSILCCVYYLHQKGRKMLLLDIKEQLFPRGGGGGQFSIICNPFQDLIVSKMCSIFQHCFLMRIYIQDSPPPSPFMDFPFFQMVYLLFKNSKSHQKRLLLSEMFKKQNKQEVRHKSILPPRLYQDNA